MHILFTSANTKCKNVLKNRCSATERTTTRRKKNGIDCARTNVCIMLHSIKKSDEAAGNIDSIAYASTNEGRIVPFQTVLRTHKQLTHYNDNEVGPIYLARKETKEKLRHRYEELKPEGKSITLMWLWCGERSGQKEKRVEESVGVLV